MRSPFGRTATNCRSDTTAGFVFVSDSQNEATIEAIAEETGLASYPGLRVEQLTELDPQFARELRDVAFQSLTRSQAQLLSVASPRWRKSVLSCFLWPVAFQMQTGKSFYLSRATTSLIILQSQSKQFAALSRIYVSGA